MNTSRDTSRDVSRERDQSAQPSRENEQLYIAQLFEKLNSRFDSMDNKFDKMESRTNHLEELIKKPQTSHLGGVIEQLPTSPSPLEDEPLQEGDDYEAQFSDDSIEGFQSPQYAQSCSTRNFSHRDAEEPIPLVPTTGPITPTTLPDLYPLPEGALLVGLSTIIWRDHHFDDRDVLIVQKPGPNPSISFKILRSATMTEHLLDLISAAKEAPSVPLSHSQGFNKAFKFLDGKLAETTGWNRPNAKTFTIKTEQFSLTQELETLSKDVLTCKRSTPKGNTKFDLDSNLDVIKYFQGARLDNGHNSDGLHLGNKLGYLKSDDIEKEANLRSDAWSACKLVEALEVTQKCLRMIPKMSLIHSQQDRDEKIYDIAEFVEYTQKSAKQLAMNLSKKALSHKASMRFDTLSKIQPPIIKDKLMKSDLLQPVLFGKDEFSAADNMAAQTVHFRNPDQRNQYSQKRPNTDYSDPSVRKKTRPQVFRQSATSDLNNNPVSEIPNKPKPEGNTGYNPKPSVNKTVTQQPKWQQQKFRSNRNYNYKQSKGTQAKHASNPYKKTNL